MGPFFFCGFKKILTFWHVSAIIYPVGRVAQLVEQLTLNQRAQSSSLCAPTINKIGKLYFRFLFFSECFILPTKYALLLFYMCDLESATCFTVLGLFLPKIPQMYTFWL